MDLLDRTQSDIDSASGCQPRTCRGAPWVRLSAGLLFVALIGTWLVWFSFALQWKHNEEDIRASCQRLMPETVERCVDTVVIQRGGMRR